MRFAPDAPLAPVAKRVVVYAMFVHFGSSWLIRVLANANRLHVFRVLETAGNTYLLWFLRRVSESVSIRSLTFARPIDQNFAQLLSTITHTTGRLLKTRHKVKC